jgi:hypothetical protein
MAGRLSVTSVVLILPLLVLGGPSYSLQEAPNEVYRWDLQAEPLVSLGGVHGRGPEEFLNVMGVVRFPDGRIAVADGGSTEIRVFSPEGLHRKTFGGIGHGPGEMPGLWGLWIVGDTLLALDTHEAVHVFSGGGKFVRRLPTRISRIGTRIFHKGFMLDMSSVGGFEEPPPRSVGRNRVPMWLVVMRGGEPQDLGYFPGRFVTRRGRDQPARPLVYGPETRVAVFPDRVCVGSSEEFKIDCIDAEGALVSQIHRQTSRREVTIEDKETYFRGMSVINAGATGFLSVLRDVTEFADRFPSFGRLVAGDSGELWVGELTPQDELMGPVASPVKPTHWSVFSEDGAWLTDFTLPRRFRLMSAGRDWIAGVRRDELDVEEVVVFRYERTLPGSRS